MDSTGDIKFFVELTVDEAVLLVSAAKEKTGQLSPQEQNILDAVMQKMPNVVIEKSQERSKN